MSEAESGFTSSTTLCLPSVDSQKMLGQNGTEKREYSIQIEQLKGEIAYLNRKMKEFLQIKEREERVVQREAEVAKREDNVAQREVALLEREINRPCAVRQKPAKQGKEDHPRRFHSLENL